MLFTSYGFIGFLAVLFLLYYICPRKCQWALLLAFSYCFYFLAGAEYVVFLCVTTVTIWFAACRIEDSADRQAAYLKEHKAELSREEKRPTRTGLKKCAWGGYWRVSF